MFVDADASSTNKPAPNAAIKAKLDADLAMRRAEFDAKQDEVVRRAMARIPDKHVERARKTLANAEKAAAPLAKPKPRKSKEPAGEPATGAKRGRPTKAEKHQPWIAAGLSKSAYYRKLKDDG